MFNFFHKNKKHEVYASISGVTIDLSRVPDEAFSEKILGDGVAIIPNSGEILSPVDGVIEQVVETSHAYCIRSNDGLEILIHVGIDTVKLNGEGFEVYVSKNQSVKKGDLIAKVDLDVLRNKGYNLHTPVIITNMSEIKNLSTINEPVEAGKTVIMTYEK